MIDELKPYPEYKDSGLPWLGKVPEHWEIKRGKTLFVKVERPVRPADEIVTCFRDGMVTLRKNRRLRGFTEAIYELGYQGIRKGDLVIHAMDAFAGAVGVADSEGKGSPIYGVCKPKDNANPHFYAGVIREMARSLWILALSRGIRERSTDFRFESFARQFLPVPPPDEQAAIVRFLDHANGKIERAIRAKKKLIALLNEQKQAIIHRAVTRGLDANVKLKPSGIPWLGDVPEHWELRRLRTLVHRIDQGVSPLAEGFIAEGDSWGVLKAGCVNRGIFREMEHKRLARSFDIDPTIVVKVGDVLVSRACGSPQLVGSVARVEALSFRLILSDKTFRPIFRDFVDVDFMVFSMNSRSYRTQVEQSISGAEGLANNLPLSSLRDFVFAIPPLWEAKEIAIHLSYNLKKLNTAVALTEREINLLREYRTTLTADIVTGKLDVREAVKRLPAEAEEALPADDLPDDLEDEDNDTHARC